MITLGKIKELFSSHPKKAGETYVQHFLFASSAAKSTAKISCIMMLHAVFPFVCETTASDKLAELNNTLQKRKKECK